MARQEVRFETIKDRLLRLEAERVKLHTQIRSGWADPMWFDIATARIYEIERELEIWSKYDTSSNEGSHQGLTEDRASVSPQPITVDAKHFGSR